MIKIRLSDFALGVPKIDRQMDIGQKSLDRDSECLIRAYLQKSRYAN